MNTETHPHEAVVRGRSLPISTKMSIIICEEIRGKNIRKAKRLLEEAIAMRTPIRFRRFHKDLSHKPGMGPARYPINTSKKILALLNTLESNAENKGLNKEQLTITTAIANFAERRWHMGRQRRTKMKNTHIEIKATEEKKEAKKETPKKEAQK